MSSERLAGLGAIVTGAASGVGAGIAARFAAEGALVVGVDIHAPAETRLHGFIRCDVTDSKAVDAAVEEACHLCGGLDVAVTSAALTGGRARFPDVTDEEWHGYVEANLSGTFFTCRAAAKVMIAQGRGGSLITVGSINSIAAETAASPYAASKGGVAQLTRAMAVDLGIHRIRANMLAPGPVEVERNTELFNSPGFLRGFAQAIPMGAAARASDIANAAVFLAEPASAMVSGTTLLIDGGMMSQITTFRAE